jgi:iron complex transport system substrate-binding protein
MYAIKSKRNVLVLVIPFFLSLTLLLGACSNNSKTSEEAAEPVSETITYTASNGDITFPRNPQRVVDVSDTYVGHLLALGVKPIGVRQWALDNPYIKEELEGVTDVGDGANIEAILALNPDLIVSYSSEVYQSTIVEQYSKVAPTAAMGVSEDMREILLEFGKMLDKETEAQKWIDHWDLRIEESKPLVQDIIGDQSVLIIQPFDKGIYVFGTGAARGGDIIYNEFDLNPPSDVQKFIDEGEIYMSYSMEKLAETPADFIFVATGSSNAEALNTLYDSDIWSTIPAVKNNRIYEVDMDGFAFNDPISINKQLDVILSKLTAK